MNSMKNRVLFVILGLGLLLLMLINLSLGSVHIAFSEVISILFGNASENSSWEYIILNFRLPKTITAIVVGAGLSVCGLVMQTLFRNPLAGPYVLGLSSGASLGVALLVLGGSIFGAYFTALLFSKWAMVIAASLGSVLVMFAVITTSIRIKDTMALLIIGLMFASLTGAVVSILAYFSPASDLQMYIFWSFGSLGNLSWNEVFILTTVVLLGLLLTTYCLKNLNALLLGENYAKSLGVPIQKNKNIIIVATGIMAGGITAFAGPIAFVGLAVPHLIRQLVKTSNHFVLFPAVIFGGASIMLICDTLAQMPGQDFTLPINAVTSIFGAPVVIWLLVQKKKMLF